MSEEESTEPTRKSRMALIGKIGEFKNEENFDAWTERLEL